MACSWWNSKRLAPLLCALIALASFARGAEPRPNVVLVMTDDQGYGDLGAHGNPVIRTPHLDRLARESARWTRFYVSPVCAPTRAALLTGRYNYRTGVTDTFLGRAMMHPDEVTLAERLAQAGYRTGIFGKWHLGDNYPMRPMEQGFQESLVHRGGGIGQPSDPPEATSYFDPILFHNGAERRESGYVSDVITNAAIEYIGRESQQPFFVYLAFNAPHTPLEVPDSYHDLYREADFAPERFSDEGQPLPKRSNARELARLYGMVTNIDDNLGKLFAALDEQGLSDSTLVIFLTDNGPQGVRYNAGMRGHKGTVYEGGIRVPLFVRWPKRVAPADHQLPAAHIDLVPTILDACGIESGAIPLDGRSLWPMLSGQSNELAPRVLFTQWHRGDAPERYRAFAAFDERWKLLRPESRENLGPARDEQFELYDIASDPYETRNVAADHPEIVTRLKGNYDRWFDDVCATRGFAPPRIVLGADAENPSTLTRQDWRGNEAGWTPQSIGHWEVEFANPGKYRFELLLGEPLTGRVVTLADDREIASAMVAGEKQALLGPLELPAGPARLKFVLEGANSERGPHQVVVERVGN